jgi:hypothetical protein
VIPYQHPRRNSQLSSFLTPYLALKKELKIIKKIVNARFRNWKKTRKVETASFSSIILPSFRCQVSCNLLESGIRIKVMSDTSRS